MEDVKPGKLNAAIVILNSGLEVNTVNELTNNTNARGQTIYSPAFAIATVRLFRQIDSTSKEQRANE